MMNIFDKIFEKTKALFHMNVHLPSIN